MAAKKLYEIGNKLPWDILQAVIGLGLCFFGGGYCASIAAVEARRGAEPSDLSAPPSIARPAFHTDTLANRGVRADRLAIQNHKK